MKGQILYLIKFFEKEEFADQLIRGELHLNRLSYFKRIEKQHCCGRVDANEATAVWLQPGRVSIEFSDHPDLNVYPKDLAAPVSMNCERHNRLHLYCMTAMHTGKFECKDGYIACAQEEVEELRRQLSVSPRCPGLGRFAVVIKAADFVDRIRKAVERSGYSFNCGLVQYFDPKSFHGNFSWNMIPFMKAAEFSYQNEYRIVVDTAKDGDSPLKISVGAIGDITAKMPSSAIANAFRLNLEPEG